MRKESLFKLVGRTTLAAATATAFHSVDIAPATAFSQDVHPRIETQEQVMTEGEWITLNPCFAQVTTGDVSIGSLPYATVYDSPHQERSIVERLPVGIIIRSDGRIRNTQTGEIFHMMYPNVNGYLRDLPTGFINQANAPCVAPAPGYGGVTST